MFFTKRGRYALHRDFNHHQRCEIQQGKAKCKDRAEFTASYMQRHIRLCATHKDALADQLEDVEKQF